MNYTVSSNKNLFNSSEFTDKHSVCYSKALFRGLFCFANCALNYVSATSRQSCMPEIRLFAIEQYDNDFSIRIKLLPALSAEMAVVPEPPNGSRMIVPSVLVTILSTSSSGKGGRMRVVHFLLDFPNICKLICAFSQLKCFVANEIYLLCCRQKIPLVEVDCKCQ